MDEHEGYTAIRYFQEVQQFVIVSNVTYHFVVQKNICLAWVKDEHVNTVLGITKSCCGGRTMGVYRLADETAIRRWSGISER